MERYLAVTAAISCALSVTGVALGQACESSSGFSVTQAGDSSSSFPELGFGSAMSGSDQRLAIGYPLQDEAGENGTVSFYVPDVSSPGNWTLEQIVSFPYPANFFPGLAGTGQVGGIQFGRAVALSGARAIAGVNGSLYATAVGFDVDYFRSTPVVYSLTNGTWVGTQLPSPFPDFSQDDRDLGLAGEFGTVVAIEGDVAVVGEPAWDPDVFPNRRFGRIHVYEHAQGVWTHVQAIPNPTQGEVNERFGQSIAIAGGVIVVGAPGDVRGSNRPGAVYLYEHDGSEWSLSAEVLPDQFDDNYRFGEDVDCQFLPDGSFELAVSNTREDSNLSNGVTGSVHLYRGTTTASLSSVSILDDAQITERNGGDFGASIDLEGGLLLIGRSIPQYRPTGNNGGAGFTDPPVANAYVASRSPITEKWLIGTVLNHPENDGNESVWLGQDVAIAGESVVIADPSAVSSDGSIASGIVYISSAAFSSTEDCDQDGFPDSCQVALNSNLGGDCDEDGILDYCVLVLGQDVDVDGNGIPDGCEPDCNCNGIPDAFDIAMGTSLDVDPQNGIPDECDNEDCNENGIWDFCEIQSGSESDINQNDIPDSCEPDCNCNGIPDDYEIQQDPMLDMNPQDGFLDECDQADIVFILDSSPSMTNFEICGVSDLCDALELNGAIVRARSYLIASGNTNCGIDGIVATDISPSLATAIPSIPGNPGSPSSCNTTPSSFDNEDWGDSIAVVSRHYDWIPGARRYIFVLSDEGPCKGGVTAAEWDSGDQSSMENAVAVAQFDGATICLIYGDGTTDGLIGFTEFFPQATGGFSYRIDSGGNGDITSGSLLPTLADDIALRIFTACQDPDCPGDTNGDGAVDLADLNVVLANFGTSGGLAQGDVTGDGQINLADLNLVLANFGTICEESQSSFSMSLTDPEELPVTVWLMLKDHPDAEAWIDHLLQFDPTSQQQDAEDLKEWVDDWEGGSPE